MKLKRLEISGFKSFFEKAVIDFPHGITAVVGPNGCGKSNVIDAIRWVMGEQSVKQLRGKSMEDVIFSGTNGKAPLGMAEVSLTLSNENGGGPEELKDFTEINLTRRLYRSGESAYFLNKQPCRLKDIHNVFLGSGLGSKSYAFIQQGNIGVITEAGPEERRYFVEEAAGVTRYKHHKAEALRKIDTTQQNLLRVADIILELKRQMGSLKRQARKAELFSKYQRRARELDVRLAAHQIDGLAAQIEATGSLLQALRDADIAHSAELKQLDAAVETIKLDRWQKNQAISDRKSEKFDLQRTVDRMEKDIEHLRGEIERLGREADALQAARRGLEEKNREMLTEVEQGESENARLRSGIEQARAALDQERAALESMTARLAAENRELEAARAALVNLTAQEAQVRNLYQNASVNRENVARRLKRADEEEARLHTTIAAAQEAEAQARAKRDALTHAIEELTQRIFALREEADATSKSLAAQVKLAQGLDLERSTTRSKHAALKKMEDNFEWYKDGVKAVMKRARQAEPDGERLEGVVGLVADVIEPEAAVAAAVEAALGETLQYIIVDRQPAGLAAIDFLSRQVAGRSGFIPADALHDTAAGQVERPDPERLLLNHVRVKPGCEAIAQALLGNVVLTDTLAEAVDLFNQNGRIQTLVTRTGEVVSPRGFLIGGSGDAGSGILAKKHELRQLEQQAAELEKKLEAARLEQKSIETAVRRMDVALQQMIERKHQDRENEIEAEKALFKSGEAVKGLRRQLEIVELEQEQLLGESSDLDDQMSRTERSLAAMAAEVESARQGAAERTQGIAALAATVHAAQQQVMNVKLEMTRLTAKLENNTNSLRRLRDFQADGLRRLEQLAVDIAQKSAKAADARTQVQEWEQALADMYRRTRQIDQEIERNEADYAAIDARLRESDATIAAIRDRREKSLEQLRVLELEQTQREMRREHTAAQIADRYHTPFAELRAELLPLVAGEAAADTPDPEALEAELNRYRAKIARIGDVNLGAIQEYQQLGERHDFLTAQKADLEKAIEDLHKVIRKINTVSQERFMQTFRAINERLGEVFPRLFNGGTAELVLTDPDKPLETGVEYMIHPPGKKLTRMSLLSGGEKAMAAIAFIFAIFLIRPASFCLMDEIDAPLDDANVYRFNDLLQHIGQNSQIVMITHNKRTMEFADTLFGITMEQKGVSKVVSVNLRRPETAAA